MSDNIKIQPIDPWGKFELETAEELAQAMKTGVFTLPVRYMTSEEIEREYGDQHGDESR